MDSGQGRLITPEAVVLHVDIAGPGTRLSARFVDLLVQGLLLVALTLMLAVGVGVSHDGLPIEITYLFGVVLIIFGYPAILESAWRGRTLGKAMFGLRVVTQEGAPIRFRHAAIRSLLFLVDGMMIGPSIGIVMIVLSRRTVRFGDVVAGTIVVREGTRAGAPSAQTFFSPPGWEMFAATIDTSSLSPALYSAIRSYLQRRATFTLETRWHLGRELADQAVAQTRQLPAGGIDPETYLRCVMAAARQHHHF